MKLTITKKPFKGKPVGSEVEMRERQAKLLVKMGRAQYQTRMMTAEAPAQVVTPANDLAIAIEQLHAMLEKPAAAPADPEVFVTPPAEREKRQYIRRRPLDAPPDGQTE